VSVGSYTLGSGIESLAIVGVGNFDGAKNNLENASTGCKSRNGLSDGGAHDTFVIGNDQNKGNLITNFIGIGASAGNSYKLVCWSARKTIIKADAADLWEIRDDVDHLEVMTIYTLVHVSDIMFGQVRLLDPASGDDFPDRARQSSS
jgi:hypothetical protein